MATRPCQLSAKLPSVWQTSGLKALFFYLLYLRRINNNKKKLLYEDQNQHKRYRTVAKSVRKWCVFSFVWSLFLFGDNLLSDSKAALYKTSLERRDGAQMGFPERLDTTLNWIELNWTELNLLQCNTWHWSTVSFWSVALIFNMYPQDNSVHPAIR